MNNFEKFLISELSKDLYDRAAEKSQRLAKNTGMLSDFHLNQAFKRKESVGDEKTPHYDLAKKLEGLKRDRRQQTTRFTAASKGVKSRRPGRGYSLGGYQENLAKQSVLQAQTDEKDKKNESIMNKFEKFLADSLMEMRRGPHDVKGERSEKYQKERDEYATRLSSMRSNVQKAGVHRKHLQKIRRASGQHDIPKEGELPKEMRGTARGRTARHGGERTDPRAPAGKESTEGGAYVRSAQGEGEMSPEQKKLSGQEYDKSQDQARRTTGGPNPTGQNTRRSDRFKGAPVISPETAKKLRAKISGKPASKPKAKAKKPSKDVSPELQGHMQSLQDLGAQGVSKGELKSDPEKAKRLDTTMKGLSDEGAKMNKKKKEKEAVSDHFLRAVTNAILINEIGDSEAGKRKIGKAYNKRMSQLSAARAESEEQHAKYGRQPTEKDALRLAKGELQVQKVANYMGGRQEGEGIADDYAKHQKRVKRELGNIGAKAGINKYKKEFGDADKDIRKRTKGEGPTSKGVKKALKNIQGRGKKDWEQEHGGSQN